MTDSSNGTNGTESQAFKVRVSGLNLSFGDNHVLFDIDFDLPAGKKSVLIGPAAAGKSVLMKCLAGLYRPDSGTILVDGEDVVVFGGGNTAVDAARSALRLGAKSVRIVYRRTQAEMPAIREELREALHEGVLFEELVSPIALRDSDTHLVVSCARMRLGEPDESGRRRPVIDTRQGSGCELSCTRAILALGTVAHGAVLDALGLRKSHYRFAHGAQHALPGGIVLADSYHCSRYITNTRRLTPEMFEAVFQGLKDRLS